MAALMSKLIQTANKYRFDGYVIEIWSQLASIVESEALVKLIKTIADSLALEQLQMILVIPPKRGKEELFTEKTLQCSTRFCYWFLSDDLRFFQPPYARSQFSVTVGRGLYKVTNWRY
ncbi:hypothetical protein NQ317_015815 [Molorchus minor]|uniref:Uncharacterized protein n=1 Tax=Molorchus minor TaxID=1323400 RepID=A0ABQ9JMD1_9CUCU|nr:hypothetical protein NQ317_015815 [Molorchus minor]